MVDEGHPSQNGHGELLPRPDVAPDVQRVATLVESAGRQTEAAGLYWDHLNTCTTCSTGFCKTPVVECPEGTDLRRAWLQAQGDTRTALRPFQALKRASDAVARDQGASAQGRGWRHAQELWLRNARLLRVIDSCRTLAAAALLSAEVDGHADIAAVKLVKQQTDAVLDPDAEPETEE